MRYFNNRLHPIRRVLVGFSQSIYEDAQKYCEVNNIRFTTLVNESVRYRLRTLREAQFNLNI